MRKSIPQNVAENEQVLEILKQNDCFVCHSNEPQLPFYANIPGVEGMLDEHVFKAQKNFNLDAYRNGVDAMSAADLAQLQYTVAMGDMPISQYSLIHWGTGFNKKEKAVLSEWINGQRSSSSNGLAAEGFKNEPVEPLVDAIAYDSAKAQLGYKMYYDTRLSKDGSLSCASCHILEKGGVSNPAYRTSEGINGQFGGVNAPTVYNACFNIKQFWNGRAADLAAQAAGPPVNPVEMGDWSWNDIVAGLSQDKALVAEFNALYTDGLTADNVCNAIGEFEKTLVTPNCAFDKYLKGDASALTEAQKQGYDLFKENKCATCHNGQAMGGNNFAYLGIHADYFADRDSTIDCGGDDLGLAGFTGLDADARFFKTPTLRNIALTAPYFHDGSKASLKDAVEAMFKYEVGKACNDAEIDAVVDFLGTLNGESKYANFN